jgi:DNA-binding NarL/FixJ family response regulator
MTRDGDPETDLDIAAIRLTQGAPLAARESALAALAGFQARHDRYGAAAARCVLGDISVLEKNPSAEGLCRDALAAVREQDPRGITAHCLETLALASVHRAPARPRRAVLLLGAAQRRREVSGLQAAVPRLAAVRVLTVRLRAEFGAAAYAELWSAGHDAATWTVIEESAGSVVGGEMVSQLTPRQREVAHLIGHGLTNREIARRLGVAEWTAVNHVRQVLRKLQCSSRVQVARLVVQQEGQR